MTVTSHELSVQVAVNSLLPKGRPARLWTQSVNFIAALVLIAAMLVVSYVLGEHDEHVTGQLYEPRTHSECTSRAPVSAMFYLVALLFVIFELRSNSGRLSILSCSMHRIDSERRLSYRRAESVACFQKLSSPIFANKKEIYERQYDN